MGFYLQVGDVVLSDGTSDSSGYSLTGHPSFPEPEPDGYGGHLPAVREFGVRCTGTTSSAANYKAALLRRECVKDNYLYFGHGASGDVLSCRIRDARVVEEEYAPAAREAFGVTLGVMLKTDPYWLGSWSAETSASASITTCAGHFDVSGSLIGGEVDALLRVRCVPTNSAAAIIAIGVKPDPAASFTYLMDYSGTAKTNALSGSAAYADTSSGYSSCSTGVAYETNTDDGTWVPITMYSALDNQGRYLALSRISACATSYSTVYVKAMSWTRAAAQDGYVAERAVALTASGLTTYELGDVLIPSYGVLNSSATSVVNVRVWQQSMSAGVYVDYLQVVPVDYAAVVVRLGSSPIPGLYYDADTDTPYVCTSSAVGYSMFDDCEIRRPLRLKPGVNNRVIVGIATDETTPDGVDTLTYSIRPRYLTAAS